MAIESEYIYRKCNDKKYKSNQPTERQKAAYIDFEEIKRIRDNLNPGLDRLLLVMYTEIPPQRSDYDSIRIYYGRVPDDNKYSNYLLIKGYEYRPMIREYKTSEKYGDIEILLNDRASSEIYNSLKEYPRDLLFLNPKGTEFVTRMAFNGWANRRLKEILNEKFTLSMFRHIYISRRDLRLEDKSGIEQEKLAKLMGHSVEEQRKYSWHTWLDNGKKDVDKMDEVKLKCKI